jgi:hypothetical protein
MLRDASFDALVTNGVSRAMLEPMRALFREKAKCEIRPLTSDPLANRYADSLLGIDAVAVRNDGRETTLQWKARKHTFLVNERYQELSPYPDFTQEYINGDGTQVERPGEWFHLYAERYFFCWANEGETDIAEWIFLDVSEYKELVNSSGGLSKVGSGPIPNSTHGRATFFASPVPRLHSVILGASKKEWTQAPDNCPCWECSDTKLGQGLMGAALREEYVRPCVMTAAQARNALVVAA